jgi:RNAse (barnase) inhibitor barstar
MTFRSFLANHPWALNLWNKITNIFSEIQWPRLQAVLNGGVYYKLNEEDHYKIKKLLKDNYLVILTHRRSHLTTYLIAIISWVTTKKSSYFTHALMNVEGDVENAEDFRLIEATGVGVHYSTFMKVFDCDGVALLKPRDIPLGEWTSVLETVKASYGAEYDTLFDISDSKKVSCVELVYQGLKTIHNYEEKFPHLVRLLEETNNDLTPQMLYDCADMDVVFEIRR